jgi:PAS domain S-box-containing protein
MGQDESPWARSAAAPGMEQPHYRALFDSMLNGIAYCKVVADGPLPHDFVYLEVNEAFESLTGLKGVVGRRVTEVIPGIRESDPELLDIYGAVAFGGRPARFERFVAGLGEWFSVSAYCPARGYFVAVFDVVTERVAIEAALRRSESRLRTVLDATTDGFWERDVPAGRLFQSARMNALVGRPPVDEVVAVEEWVARIHQDDVAGFLPQNQDVLAGRMQRTEVKYRVRCEDGTWKWVRSIGSIVERDESGRATRLAGIVSDVDAATRTEEALRKRESELRAVFNSQAVGIAVLGSGGEFTQVNDFLCTLLGHPREELLGMTWLDITHPLDVEGDHVAAASMRAGEVEGFVREKRYVRKDGTPVWCQSSISCIRGPGGEVQSTFVIVQDIQERRRAQERAEVASRLAAVGTLVAGVAHEVNNPLAGAMAGEGFAVESLRELRDQAERGELRDPRAIAGVLREALEGLGDAEASLQRIARIVKDLAMFGRPESVKAPVRLVDAVDQAMKWLPAALSGSATIQVENLGAPPVLATIGQLTQVVVNIVSNAAKAIPRGERGTIHVRVGPGGPGMARLEVEDDGVGMAPDVLSRIFDPFFTTRVVGQGMGLGLAITHAIVTGYGGSVSVKSEVGKGSTFTVELPAAPV